MNSRNDGDNLHSSHALIVCGCYFYALLRLQVHMQLRGELCYIHIFHCRWPGNPHTILRTRAKEEKLMAFFNSAVSVLQTLVVALGADLGIWGAINLLEGRSNDNPGTNAHVR